MVELDRVAAGRRAVLPPDREPVKQDRLVRSRSLSAAASRRAPRHCYGLTTLQEKRCLADTAGATFTLKLRTAPSIVVTWTTAFGVA